MMKKAFTKMNCRGASKVICLCICQALQQIYIIESSNYITENKQVQPTVQVRCHPYSVCTLLDITYS